MRDTNAGRARWPVYVIALAGAAACGEGAGLGGGSAGGGIVSAGDGTTTDDGTGDGESSDAGDGDRGPKFDVGAADEGGTDAVDECPPPDLLFVLDRSYSMHQRPDGESPPDTNAGYTSTKWFIVIGALEGFMQAYSGVVRFGLELFPGHVHNGPCGSMAAVVGDAAETDGLVCTAELVAPPEDDAAASIAAQLDPFGTPLCRGTPIQVAIEAAEDTLSATAGDQEQFVVLLTDGRERCDGNPLGAMHQLAQAGIRSYVIGFGDTRSDPEGHMTLNHLACAGRTAPGFPAGCMDDGFGNYTAMDATDTSVTLYLTAEDGDGLASLLEDDIASTLCCGTACPPG